MIVILKKALSATLLSCFVVCNADASGFYVSGKVGSTEAEHTIERNIGSGVALPVSDTSGVTSAHETNVSGGLAIGYEHDFMQEEFFVGLEGFYNVENTSTKNINSVLVTDVDINATYGGRMLVGINATDKLALYAHGGATALDIDIRNSYTFAPPVKTSSETEVGFSFGGGVGYDLSNNISVFAEYTRINNVDFSPIPEVAGGTGRINKNTLDYSNISLGVKYAF